MNSREWRTETCGRDGHRETILTDGNHRIDGGSKKGSEEAVAFLARAANSHEELLDCLEWAATQLRYSFRTTHNQAHCDRIDAMNNAIKEARRP